MTTYLEMVNKLIRRVNEVELDSSNFASARGVHGAIKDGIVDTLDKIYQRKYKWPFLAVLQTQVLTAGDQQYSWPADFLSVDWNSFQLQKDETLNVASKTLKVLQREEWYRYRRDGDTDSLPDGRNIPVYVFSDQGLGWGVTPNPERAYTIKYTYYKNPVRPTLYSDEILLPKEYEFVVMAGALYHMYLFYDNNERATIAKEERDVGIADMVNSLLANNMEHMYAGVVNGVNW